MYIEKPIPGIPEKRENKLPNGLLIMYAKPEFAISFDKTIKQNSDGITPYKQELIELITETEVASGINNR